MKNIENKQFKLQGLGNITRKVVKLTQGELIKLDFLKYGETLPVVLKPAVQNVDLINWIKDNQEFLQTKLLKQGAILLRGFNLERAAIFEQVCLMLCPNLFNENGEHIRGTVSANVYTPVFYPANKKLLWHNENSFNYRWPKKIFFGCSQPAEQGGETPIVDSRKVFELIDPKIRERFIEKKVMYLRNYDSRIGLDWSTVFQTQDQAKVEANCKEAGIDFEWKDNGRLRTRAVRPAVVKHPQTDEMTWFAQLQHWHTSCLDIQTRQTLLSSFQEEDLPRNCYYGDGSHIEDSVMEEICGVYEKLEITFSWQTGDLLILDNLLTAHGRNPFCGERKLFVAMGEMISFDEI
ncbi:TauD/TfdA family dioxygenase [Nostoc sp.]|uniref:TauD/TfdA family dioxygenase n=1 Tax=Nostoc sp. TaxID=1180 RepID=UPI002FF4F281